MERKYLITITKARDDGDLKGNQVPTDLLGMDSLTLQKALAFDLVRIAEAREMPFQGADHWAHDKLVWKENQKQEPLHRPEFG